VKRSAGTNTGAAAARGHARALADAPVVRPPLRPGSWLPDFFVQHPKSGWLAIAVAGSANLCLIGFARDGHCSVYAHPQRLLR